MRCWFYLPGVNELVIADGSSVVAFIVVVGIPVTVAFIAVVAMKRRNTKKQGEIIQGTYLLSNL